MLLLRAVYDVGSAHQEAVGELCATLARLLRQQPAACRHATSAAGPTAVGAASAGAAAAVSDLDRSFDETDHRRVAELRSVRADRTPSKLFAVNTNLAESDEVDEEDYESQMDELRNARNGGTR